MVPLDKALTIVPSRVQFLSSREKKKKKKEKKRDELAVFEPIFWIASFMLFLPFFFFSLYTFQANWIREIIA